MRTHYATDNVTVIGYSSYDGYVTTHYDTNWLITSLALNTGALWSSVTVDGAVTRYAYTDAYGDEYVYATDSSGNVTGYSVNYGNSDYTYDYGATGDFLSYTYSDGVTTTTYYPDGTVKSTSVNTDAFAGMTPVYDGDALIGYSQMDEWGATTTYFVDPAGAITGTRTTYSYEWNGQTWTYSYDYDAEGNFTGYSYSDGVTTTEYDANWNLIGSTADVDGMAVDAATGLSYYTDDWNTTYYFNPDGSKHGSSYTYTYSYDNGQGGTDTYVYTSFYNAAGYYTGSETTLNGTVAYSDTYTYDSNGNFLGYEYFDGVTTTKYDANWNLTRSTADVDGMAVDAATGLSYYTDDWNTTYYFNPDGSKHGSSYTYTYSYDNGQGGTDTYVYTSFYNAAGYYTGSETTLNGTVAYSDTYTYDSNGNFLGYEYFDGVTTTKYDANWNLTGSTADVDGMAVDAATGLSYYTDDWNTTYYFNPDGSKHGSSYTYTYSYDNGQGGTDTYVYTSFYNAAGYYTGSETTLNGTVAYSDTYTYDSNGNFLGYEYFDGVTTTKYDANWNLTGSTADVDGMAVDAATGLSYYTDDWNTTYYFNPDGSKHGSSYTYTSSYDDGQGGTYTYVYTSFYNAAGYYTGSETTINGVLSYSDTYHYDDFGNFLGYTYFDGITTWNYDDDWNLIGSEVDLDNLISDGAGGYYSEDDSGRTFYNDQGEKTGSEYRSTWTDERGEWEYISRYDADGSYNGSETHLNGDTVYSDEYEYDDFGNVVRYTYFDGVTTTVYDADWQIISMTASTEGMQADTFPFGDPPINCLSNSETYSYDYGTSTTVNYYNDQGVRLGYAYVWTVTDANAWDFGHSYASGYDDDGHYLGSITTDGTGALLYSTTYLYDPNGEYLGYVNFDGTSTWTYDANGYLTSVTAQTADMDEVRDPTSGLLIGYSDSDSYGTTSFYNLNGVKTGSTYTSSWTDETTQVTYRSISKYDAEGRFVGSENYEGDKLTSSNHYFYDANGEFAGYEYFDGTTTWTYDAEYNLVSSEVDTKGMTPVYEGETQVGWQSEKDDYGTTTFYDLQGVITGYRTEYSYTGEGYTSTNSSTYNANWNLISSNSSWTDPTGGSGTNSNTTVFNEQGEVVGHTETGSWTDGTNTSSHEYHYDADWNFTGGTSTYNGFTTIYGPNWEPIGDHTFMVTLDPTPDDGDTLVGTFQPWQSRTIELHDKNGDGAIDQMISKETWTDQNNVEQYEENTYAVTWNEAGDNWTAYHIETMTFDTWDTSGRPTYINGSDGFREAINWLATPQGVVVATMDFTETDDDSQQRSVHVDLNETAGGGYPDSLDVYFDGVFVSSMDLTGWIEDANQRPTSVTMQTTFGVDSYDMVSGTATFNDQGEPLTVTVDFSSGGGGGGTTDTIPGDSTTTAMLNIGSSVNGLIDTDGDEDWYQVTLEAGQTYTFTQTGSTGLNSYLELYDASSLWLASNDDDGSSLNSRLVFTATSSGTYYVSASAYDINTGTYSLTANLGETVIDNIYPTFTSANFAEGSNTVTLTFSEAITYNNTPYFTLHQNPDIYDGQGGWTSPSLGVTNITGSGTNTLTLTTGTTFATGDVLRLSYYGNLTDQAGNWLNSQEIWFGGTAADVIDLDGYGSEMPTQLRGNVGSDYIVGTVSNDVLVDGGGADTLLGSDSADAIRLVENGGVLRPDDTTGPAYSRDVVKIEPGESTFWSMDFITPRQNDTDNGPGFDIYSTDASKHDVLDLTHKVIAANTDGKVAGTVSGVVYGHSISNGLVTYYDGSGNALTVNTDSAYDVAQYTMTNIQMATGAFLVDFDGNGENDSTGVFQCQGGFIEPTVVMLQHVVAQGVVPQVFDDKGNDISAVGSGIIVIQDTQAPEPIGDDEFLNVGTSTNVAFSLDFAEAAYATTGIAVSMLVNGTNSLTVSSVEGGGTNHLTFNFSGTLLDTDWVLMNYTGSTVNDAISDASGNILMSDSEPGSGGWITGMEGNNTIDLSSVTDGTFFDIEGRGGNDTITGGSGGDWIVGGEGADVMTGGAGDDEFAFDFFGYASPAFTLSSGVYTFAGGAADVITDFSMGDAAYVETDPDDWNDFGSSIVRGDYSAGAFTSNTTTGNDALLIFSNEYSSAEVASVVLSGVGANLDNIQVGGNWVGYYTNVTV